MEGTIYMQSRTIHYLNAEIRDEILSLCSYDPKLQIGNSMLAEYHQSFKCNISNNQECAMALCTIFTILQTLWNSEQKKGLLIELFYFSFDFDETWWNCFTQWVLQLHQVPSKLDEKQKSFDL